MKTMFLFMTGPILLLYASALFFACSDPDIANREQFKKLETALDRISVEKDPNWIKKVDAVEKITIDSDRIRAVQKKCVAAHREYAKAMDEMADGARRLKQLENAVAAGQTQGLAKKYAQTKEAIAQTTAHLDQSESLIQSCMAERRVLKKALKLTRN